MGKPLLPPGIQRDLDRIKKLSRWRAIDDAARYLTAIAIAGLRNEVKALRDRTRPGRRRSALGGVLDTLHAAHGDVFSREVPLAVTLLRIKPALDLLNGMGIEPLHMVSLREGTEPPLRLRKPGARPHGR